MDIRKLIVAHEYAEGSILSTQDFEATALRNVHPPVTESYALKFKLDNMAIVFSSDTAYCPKLIPFSSQADYLVHEVCMYPLLMKRSNAAQMLPNAGRVYYHIIHRLKKWEKSLLRQK